MDKLERLGWAGGFSVKPEGFVVGIRCNDLYILEELKRRILLPQWEVGPLAFHSLFSLLVGGERRPGFRNFSLLYDGLERVARSLSLEEVMGELEQRLHQRIAGFPYSKLSFRGLALALDGKAHLFLGNCRTMADRWRSRWKKRGARLLAPAHIFLDREGLVHPYLNRDPLGDLLALPAQTQPCPLSRVWVLDQEQATLSPAQLAWHLFRHLQNYQDAAANLEELIRRVWVNQVQGFTLGPDSRPCFQGQ